MGKNEPVTKTVKASEARQQWSELLNEVFKRETRVVVEKSGVPVAAIVSTEDLARMVAFEKQREQRFKILDEIGEAFKDVPLEELEQEVTRAVAEARADIRKQKQSASQAGRRPLTPA